MSFHNSVGRRYCGHCHLSPIEIKCELCDAEYCSFCDAARHPNDMHCEHRKVIEGSTNFDYEMTLPDTSDVLSNLFPENVGPILGSIDNGIFGNMDKVGFVPTYEGPGGVSLDDKILQALGHTSFDLAGSHDQPVQATVIESKNDTHSKSGDNALTTLHLFKNPKAANAKLKIEKQLSSKDVKASRLQKVVTESAMSPFANGGWKTIHDNIVKGSSIRNKSIIKNKPKKQYKKSKKKISSLCSKNAGFVENHKFFRTLSAEDSRIKKEARKNALEKLKQKRSDKAKRIREAKAKGIRYGSRKTIADIRPRVKGRFVKTGSTLRAQTLVGE